MKKILLAFTFLSLFSNMKAQDDDINAGWYSDGYKVSSVSCYNFDKLQFVVPYNPEWESYDHIGIRFWRGEKMIDYSGVKVYTLSAIQALKKGNYVVISVMTREQSLPLAQNGYPDGTPGESASALNFKISRWDCAYQVVDIGDGKKKETPAFDVILNATVYGLTQTEVIEKYDEGCQCVKKIPKYSSVKIEKNYPVTMTGRIWKKWNAALNTTEVCTYAGNKVDFNELGKTTSGAAAKPASASNTPAKTETPAKTANVNGKTVITSVAPTSAAAVKPLDKTKPGYFEEKSDDKKYIYRNGYQTSPGTYHGEVREYESNNLEKIIIYTNGVEDGLYIIFSDGKVEWSGNYKNGKKDGAWKHYKDGMLEETDKYINGEKQ